MYQVAILLDDPLLFIDLTFCLLYFTLPYLTLSYRTLLIHVTREKNSTIGKYSWQCIHTAVFDYSLILTEMQERYPLGLLYFNVLK